MEGQQRARYDAFAWPTMSDRYLREAVTAGDRGEGVLMLAQLNSSRVKRGAGMRATFLIGHEVDAFSIEPSHISGRATSRAEPHLGRRAPDVRKSPRYVREHCASIEGVDSPCPA